VLLLSLAFMATGGFLGLHALGTPGILFTKEHAGLLVAIPVGLLVSAVFAGASAFVDLAPALGQRLIRHRTLLRAVVLIVMAEWFIWTVADLPPLNGESSEAARGRLNVVLAIVGTVVYAVSAARCWRIFRQPPKPASAGRYRLLRLALGSDDRRCGHRRTQVARELVGVAWADRGRIARHRLRCSS
jgi:adenylate cyclase